MFFLFFAKPSLIQKLALGNAVMGMFPDGGRFARGTLREGTFCLCRGFDQRTFSKQLKISESSERLRVHSVHSTPCTVCALLCTLYLEEGGDLVWSGYLQLLLDEPGSVLVPAELHPVAGDVGQGEGRAPVAPDVGVPD